MGQIEIQVSPGSGLEAWRKMDASCRLIPENPAERYASTLQRIQIHSACGWLRQLFGKRGNRRRVFDDPWIRWHLPKRDFTPQCFARPFPAPANRRRRR
jgi:hypothetical protein